MGRQVIWGVAHSIVPALRGQEDHQELAPTTQATEQRAVSQRLRGSSLDRWEGDPGSHCQRTVNKAYAPVISVLGKWRLEIKGVKSNVANQALVTALLLGRTVVSTLTGRQGY